MIALDARLYLILTPAICRVEPVATARRALAGGVDLVQLRDKDASPGAYRELARALVDLCGERGVPLILNDRVELVDEVGAAGAHVGEDDTPAEQARALLGPDRLLGISTHDRAEAVAARARGADYIGLGPMYATGTKRLSREPGGATLVRSIVGATELPFFPIGGITLGNAPRLLDAGATRLAISAAICSSPDPEGAARSFCDLLR